MTELKYKVGDEVSFEWDGNLREGVVLDVDPLCKRGLHYLIRPSKAARPVVYWVNSDSVYALIKTPLVADTKPEEPKEKELKVGDKVRISEDSEWYTGSSNNPTDEEGVVKDIHGRMSLPVKVEWSGGKNNCYHEKDLIVITTPVIKPREHKHANLIRKWSDNGDLHIYRKNTDTDKWEPKRNLDLMETQEYALLTTSQEAELKKLQEERMGLEQDVDNKVTEIDAAVAKFKEENNNAN